jgi:hypothetical protein
VLLDTETAQPLGAGALEELQVVGVIDDATRVGVFPIDARRVAKRLAEEGSHRLTRMIREPPGAS